MDKLKKWWVVVNNWRKTGDVLTKTLGLAFVAIMMLAVVAGAVNRMRHAASSITSGAESVVAEASAPAVAPVAQAPAPAQPAQQAQSAQAAPAQDLGILSPAIYKIEEGAKLTAGKLKLKYAYANTRNAIENPALLNDIGEVVKDERLFQFQAQPSGDVAQQIATGDEVIVRTAAEGFFLVDQQSAPTINVRAEGRVAYRVDVYIDGRLTPSATVKHDVDWTSEVTPVTLAAKENLASGYHKLQVVVTMPYTNKTAVAVRVAIKRPSEQLPSDLAVLLDVPQPVAAPVSTTPAPSQPVAPVNAAAGVVTK